MTPNNQLYINVNTPKGISKFHLIFSGSHTKHNSKHWYSAHRLSIRSTYINIKHILKHTAYWNKCGIDARVKLISYQNNDIRFFFYVWHNNNNTNSKNKNNRILPYCLYCKRYKYFRYGRFFLVYGFLKYG